MTRKKAIEIVMERDSRLPHQGKVAFVARIGSNDYFIENIGGYCKLVIY